MNQVLLISALLLSALVGILSPPLAGAADGPVATRISLLVGFPDQDAGAATGALVVPGTVIPINVELSGGPPAIDVETRRTLELAAMGAKLKAALRLAEVEVSYTQEIALEVDSPRDLAGPGGESEVAARITLIGYSETTASYQVQFYERSAVLADTPVAVARGQRAVVGSVDGDAAPFLFLIIEPVAATAGQVTQPLVVGGDVQPPRAISKIAPQYTEEARKERLEGVVIVQATIGTSGRVEHLKILKGLPMGMSEAAIEAIRQWRFEPATLAGKPVAVYYNLTVNFRLDKDKPADG